MNYNDIKRKVMPGDSISCRDKVWNTIKNWKVKEILSQDVYRDEDAGKYGIEDKSYIHIEFKDTNEGYHYWKSNLDGGTVVYKEDLQKVINDVIDKDFKKFFYGERLSILEVTRVLKDEGFGQEEIFASLLRCIGGLHWED